MKTLLITTLTTALLSFNSFADTTSEIKDLASVMAKAGIEQMNKQLAVSSRTDIKNYLNIADITVNSKGLVLLTRSSIRNSDHVKRTTHAADE